VYRPSNGGWYILKSSTNYTTYVGYVWGLGGDVPVAADYGLFAALNADLFI
jgi:hypothetical protein